MDGLEKEITHYLAKVSQSGMNADMSILHTGLLHAANDLERISDHADNIADLAHIAIEGDISFSPEAMEELREMYQLVLEVFEAAVQSVRDHNTALIPKVKALEAQIDAKEEALRDAHIKRLKEGRCNAESGVVFLDIISNFERIGDHSNNVSHLTQGKL